MFKHKFFTQSLTLILLTFTFLSSANAVQWTAGELANSLEQARLSETPFDRILAAKVQEELELAGVKVVRGSIQYNLNVPGTTLNINNVDPDLNNALTILTGNGLISNVNGKCEVPLPAASLINFRSQSFNFNAYFDALNTTFALDTAPGKVIVNVGIDAALDVSPIPIGFEWGGIYPVPEAYCAATGIFGECIFWAVRTKWECSKWTDWVYANVTGNLKGNFTLELNHSFAEDPDPSKNRIVISNYTTLSGELTGIPLIVTGSSTPDLSPIHVPTHPAIDLFANSFNGLYPMFASFVSKEEMAFVLGSNVTYEFFNIIPTAGSKLKSMLDVEQARINSEFSAPIYINIPDESPELKQVVLDILKGKGIVIPQLYLDIIKTRWDEIIYNILTESNDALVQLLETAICDELGKLKTTMPTTPIYAIDSSNTCIVADPSGIDHGNYFSDANCLVSIEFQPENFQAFCKEVFTAAPNPLLGNPKLWSSLGYKNDLTQGDISTKWSLASATQLQIGRESLKGVNAPFVKRVRFRDVGNCALEMRVYKKDINATDLKPLIFFHGGSWTLRGGGYVGAEALLSHYTDAGFAVFTPFYRMSSDGDGPVECQNASWQEITSDSEAALKWVQDFGGQFGADTTRIAVAGQSSGAHLAGWLVTHRSAEVDRALLIYPPTDVYDFINRLQQNTFGNLANGLPYNPEDAVGTASALYDVDAVTIENTNLLNPPMYVMENSYAEIVKAAPSSYPPVFLMHGMNDALLDASQSVALCNAYGGSAIEYGGGPVDLRAVYNCGKNSVMHLFEEAEHAFEICAFPGQNGGCYSGSTASADIIVNSMQAAREWLLLDCKNLKQKCK